MALVVDEDVMVGGRVVDGWWCWWWMGGWSLVVDGWAVVDGRMVDASPVVDVWAVVDGWWMGGG